MFVANVVANFFSQWAALYIFGLAPPCEKKTFLSIPDLARFCLFVVDKFVANFPSQWADAQPELPKASDVRMM